MTLFGWLRGDCFHSHYTFPMRKRGETLCHVACLDCARTLPYSWEEMRILSEREAVEMKSEVSLGEWLNQARIDCEVERILSK